MAKKQFQHFSNEILSQALTYENLIDKIQFRNQSVLYYTQYLGKRNVTNKFYDSDSEKANEAYTGYFTDSAKKNLKKAIDILLQITEPVYRIHPITKKKFKHHLSVITLTIPNSQVIHPQTAYNNCLKPFLQYLTKTEKVSNYIWKLEFQKRGQLHYHITMPEVIHWKLIRSKWNYLLNKHNYCSEYIEKFGHNNPNSTDIHKVYKIKNIQSYLAKEFIKSIQQFNPNKDKYTEEYSNIQYRFWDCSKAIKGNKYFTLEIDENNAYPLLNYINSNKEKLKEISSEHCCIFQAEEKIIRQIIPVHERENYYNYINDIKNKCHTNNIAPQLDFKEKKQSNKSNIIEVETELFNKIINKKVKQYEIFN